MALWINASGPPTTMLKWLSGSTVYLAGGPAPDVQPGQAVALEDVEGYLALTGEFRRHTNQMPALKAAVAVGVAALNG